MLTEAGVPPLDLYLNQRAARLLFRPDYREKYPHTCELAMRAAWPGDGHSIAIDPAELADDILRLDVRHYSPGMAEALASNRRETPLHNR